MRNNALSALAEIAVAMSGPGALCEGLRTALDHVLSTLDLRIGAILIRDAQGGLRISSTMEERLGEISPQTFEAGHTISDLCMESGERVVIADLRREGAEPSYRHLADELGLEAAVSMPLRCGSTVRAVLSLGLPEQSELTADQMEFVDLAAAILGPAIENASLHSDLTDRVNRLAMLERLAKSVNAERDVHTVIDACMREVAGLVAYDFGVVVLLRDDGDAEVFLFSADGVACSVSKVQLDEEQIKNAASVHGPVAFVHGAEGIPMHTRPDTFEHGEGSGAVAPLMCMGRMFGLLKVWTGEKGRYGKRETEILASAAEHLSIAAHNAGLYEAEQRRSLELAAVAQEAHHRIKNNLQAITGLLGMSLNDKSSANSSVGRCLRQVRAIASVHELLNPANMTAKIRLDECLSKIAASAVQATGRGESIELVVAGDGCMVTTDSATAVGVIVNELVSNAIEHGFVGLEKGRIEIRISGSERELLVEVIDDGLGLPSDFAMPEVPDSATGLGVVSSLATYGLGGCLEIARAERGTRAAISLKGA